MAKQNGQPQEPKSKVLYEKLKQDPNYKGIGKSYESFVEYFSEPDKSQMLYEKLSQDKKYKGLGKSHDSFTDYFGLKKKEDTTQSTQQSDGSQGQSGKAQEEFKWEPKVAPEDGTKIVEPSTTPTYQSVTDTGEKLGMDKEAVQPTEQEPKKEKVEGFQWNMGEEPSQLQAGEFTTSRTKEEEGKKAGIKSSPPQIPVFEGDKVVGYRPSKRYMPQVAQGQQYLEGIDQQIKEVKEQLAGNYVSKGKSTDGKLENRGGMGKSQRQELVAKLEELKDRKKATETDNPNVLIDLENDARPYVFKDADSMQEFLLNEAGVEQKEEYTEEDRQRIETVLQRYAPKEAYTRYAPLEAAKQGYDVDYYDLNRFESEANVRLNQPWGIDYLNNFMQGGIEFVGGAVEGLEKGVNKVAVTAGLDQVGISKEGEIMGIGGAINGIGKEVFPTDPEKQDNWNTQAMRALGQAGAMVAMGFMSGGSMTAAGVSAGATGSLNMANQMYEEALEGGATPEEAWTAYLIGLPAGGFEGIPIARVFGIANKVTGGRVQGSILPSIVKNMAKQGVTEAGQETVQGMVQNMTAKELYDFSREIIDENVIQGAEIGLFVGSLMGSAINVNAYNTVQEQELARQAKENFDRIAKTKSKDLVNNKTKSDEVQKETKQKEEKATEAPQEEAVLEGEQIQDKEEVEQEETRTLTIVEDGESREVEVVKKEGEWNIRDEEGNLSPVPEKYREQLERREKGEAIADELIAEREAERAGKAQTKPSEKPQSTKTKKEGVDTAKAEKTPQKASIDLVKEKYGLQESESAEGVFVNDPDSEVELAFSEGSTESSIKLESIRVKEGERGKGKAKEALQELTDYADEQGLSIELDVLPEEVSEVDQTLNKYGWSKEETEAGTELKNAKGKTVAIVKDKKNGYVIEDTGGAKLLSGKGKLPQSIESVAKEYFFAKEREVSEPTTTEGLTKLYEGAGFTTTEEGKMVREPQKGEEAASGVYYHGADSEGDLKLARDTESGEWGVWLSDTKKGATPYGRPFPKDLSELKLKDEGDKTKNDILTDYLVRTKQATSKEEAQTIINTKEGHRKTLKGYAKELQLIGEYDGAIMKAELTEGDRDVFVIPDSSDKIKTTKEPQKLDKTDKTKVGKTGSNLSALSDDARERVNDVADDIEFQGDIGVESKEAAIKEIEKDPNLLKNIIEGYISDLESDIKMEERDGENTDYLRKPLREAKQALEAIEQQSKTKDETKKAGKPKKGKDTKLPDSGRDKEAAVEGKPQSVKDLPKKQQEVNQLAEDEGFKNIHEAVNSYKKNVDPESEVTAETITSEQVEQAAGARNVAEDVETAVEGIKPAYTSKMVDVKRSKTYPTGKKKERVTLKGDKKKQLQDAVLNAVRNPTKENHNKLYDIFTEIYESPYRGSNQVQAIWNQLHETFPELTEAQTTKPEPSESSENIDPLENLGVNTTSITINADKIKKAINDFFKKWFRVGMGAPKDVKRAKTLRDGLRSAIIGKMNYMISDVRKAAINHYGRKIPQDAKNDMRLALSGEIPISSLPEQIRTEVQNMRDYIDSLTEDMIRQGLVSPEMAEIFESNLGKYVNRAYAIFDNAGKWKEAIPEEVKQSAAKFIGGQLDEMVKKKRNQATRLKTRNKKKEIDKLDTWRKNQIESLDKQIQEQQKKKQTDKVKDKITQLTDQKELLNDQVDKKIANLKDRDFNQEANALLEQAQEIENNVEQEATRLVNQILSNVEPNEFGLLSMSNLTSISPRFKGILKNRKNVPPEIRALLGEYTDPVTQFGNTVFKMANMIAQKQMFQDILNTQLGKTIFDPKVHTKIPADAFKEMTIDGKKYVTTEFIHDVMTHRENIDLPFLARYYMKLTAGSKVAQTVFSVKSQIRNFVSNPLQVLKNGHNPLRVRRAFEALRADWGGNNKAAREYIFRLRRLKVIGDSVGATELQRMIEDATQSEGNIIEALEQTVLGKMKKKTIGSAQKAYGWGDDFWKIVNFEADRSMFKEAYPDKTDAEIDMMAAERTRATMPSYDQLPLFVQRWRRFPLVGPFVAFTSEQYRTHINSLAFIKEDYNSGNEVLKRAAVKRAFGTIMALGLPKAMAIAALSISGFDDDDLFAIKQLAPPWMRNADMLITSGKDKINEGVVEYVDMSFMDPNNDFKKAYLNPTIDVIMGDRTAKEAMKESVTEAAAPFIGMDLFFGALLNGAMKADDFGSTNEEKAKIIIDEVAQSITPGTIRDLRKIYMGFTGRHESYSEEATYNPYIELTSMLTGVRQSKVDVEYTYERYSKDFMDDIRNISYDYNKVMKAKNSTDQEKKDATEKANKKLKKTYEEAHEMYMYGVKLGVNPEVIENGFTKGNLSKSRFNDIKSNDPDYKGNSASSTVRTFRE